MRRMIEAAAFSDLDREFFRFMMERSAGEAAALAGALLCSRVSSGDTCLDIGEASGKPLGGVLGSSGEGLDDPLLAEKLPSGKTWISSLKKSPVVGSPGERAPLVLDGSGRLYLYRYWEYEQIVAGTINARLAQEPPPVDGGLLRGGLERYFPGSPGDGPDWQRVAALRALTGHFTVISGGPGTGKTSTVARIIALLIEQALARGEAITIALAAPTGKAAARLKESVEKAFAPGGALEKCGDDLRARFPRDASTIHRLLRPLPGTPYFRHNAENPLPFDVVVADESSMVDLALMAKLLSAVPLASRMILLGDRDQLASVEAGSVLGDICGGGLPDAARFSEDFAATVKSISGDDIPRSRVTGNARPIQDAIVLLEKSYRFNEGIAGLARAINAGDSDAASINLAEGSYESVTLRPLGSTGELPGRIAALAAEGQWDLLASPDTGTALERFFDFMLLCPLRRGPMGSETVNEAIGSYIARGRRSGEWYHGRPVMVTRNDYDLGLFNGDIGIAAEEPGRGFSVRFPGLGPVAAVRLPRHETVYALTVHKSQGSEFSRVILVLPDSDSPVLTRQLLYTAVTRAREGIEIWGSAEILARAVNRPITRSSGLRAALWDER
jgi:exodeoxyribonuclease V alpha subunit